ncbi:MAG: hypothetical protein QMD04_09325 [Anaerolineales bacterium]|nr:hypothetical protein [Anaerolineales bacterium]
MDADIKALSDSLIYEILNALGLPKTERMRAVIAPLFCKATERLATLGIGFDRQVEKFGFSRAAEWILPGFVREVTERGAEQVPPEGPLLVVSNHPGTYDSLLIVSRLGRDDLKIITGDIPFLRGLPRAREHFLSLTQDINQRMNIVRAAIRHLQQGGALMLFGSGHIDPDPAISEEAATHIDLWSQSIDLFLRFIPETRLLLTIVSHAVAAKWARSPITWLRRKSLDKLRLAGFCQVLQQLFFPGSLYLSPRLGFAPPVSVEDLQRESDCERLLPAIIMRAKALLNDHIHWAVSAEG